MAYFDLFRLYNEMARVINLVDQIVRLVTNFVGEVGHIPREKIVKHFLAFDYYLEKDILISKIKDSWLILENYPNEEELARIKVEDNPFMEFQKFLDENYPGLRIVENCWFDLKKQMVTLEFTTNSEDEKNVENIFNEFSEDIEKLSEVWVGETEANDYGGYLDLQVKANFIP